MRSLEQIVADNGGDNTPALDTHNLTGRALCGHQITPAFRCNERRGHGILDERLGVEHRYTGENVTATGSQGSMAITAV